MANANPNPNPAPAPAPQPNPAPVPAPGPAPAPQPVPAPAPQPAPPPVPPPAQNPPAANPQPAPFRPANPAPVPAPGPAPAPQPVPLPANPTPQPNLRHSGGLGLKVFTVAIAIVAIVLGGMLVWQKAKEAVREEAKKLETPATTPAPSTVTGKTAVEPEKPASTTVATKTVVEPEKPTKPITEPDKPEKIRAEAPPAKAVSPAPPPLAAGEKLPDIVPSGKPDEAIKDFFGTGLPTTPTFKNEEQKKTSRQREEWLVAKLFSQSPVSDRVKAAEELGDYPYYRVARALSFVLGRQRKGNDGKLYWKGGDEFAEVRKAAANSLGKVANVEFVPALENSVSFDDDADVQAASKAAAEQIKARSGNGLSTTD